MRRFRLVVCSQVAEKIGSGASQSEDGDAKELAMETITWARNTPQRQGPTAMSAASVLARKRSLVWLRISCALFCLRLRLSRLVFATWFVIGSSVGRILLLRSIFAGRPLLSIVANLEVDSSNAQAPSKRTNVRSRDIQLLREAYLWATVADLHFLLLGGNKGEEYAGRESGTGNSCNIRTDARS